MTLGQKVLIIVFWVTVFIPVFISPLILLIVSIVLLVLVLWNTYKLRKEGYAWKLYLLLSPPVALFVIGFFIGVFGYLTGNATFVYHSRQNEIKMDSYQNFDHDYRVYYSDFRGNHYGPISGIGLAYMYRGKANDLTIKLLTNIFGYQSGMYQGKIPNPKEIYSAFKTDSIYSISLTDASPDFAEFEFKGKKYHITATSSSDEDIESPIKCSTGALKDVYRKMKNGREMNFGEKKLDPGATFSASMKYYPLMIVTEFDPREDDCTEIQLVDLERGIRFAHYSIKGAKVYPCTFCYCW